VRRLVYVIGQPGAGKTTVMRAVTGQWMAYPRRAPGFACPHVAYGDDGRVIQLGQDRADFGGTDALAMNIQPRAVELMATTAAEVVLAEGDRLGNDKFLSASEALGWEVRVVWIALPDAVARARCAGRGSDQAEAWVRGRRTKVRRLAERWGPLKLDGTRPVEELAVEIRGLIPTTADAPGG
jgi:hypothetical protein